MGSSKVISGREIFLMMVLLQQGGLFWMLPVLLFAENGTAGLLAFLPGLSFGLVILAVCLYWHRHCAGMTFPQWLKILLGRYAGTVAGIIFLVLYLMFGVLCLGSFTEVIHTRLLPETPRILLLLPVFFLAGWLSWNGLEDIARMTVFAVIPGFLLLALMTAGSIGSFRLENLLPVQIWSMDAMGQSAISSIFACSSFLVLFMVFPAWSSRNQSGRTMLFAVVLSSALFLLWNVLALGVFGQFSMSQLIWLPLELARMIQVSAFLERTEALFTAVWMPLVLVNGGLWLWSVSESAHQISGMQKNNLLHWLTVVVSAVICAAAGNLLQLYRLEQMIASVSVYLIPVLLLLVTAGTVLYSRRKEEQH